MLFRIVASLVVVVVVVMSMFLFGDHIGKSSGQDAQQPTQSAPAPSSDDDAIRKSLSK